jgi:IS5 family transposase
VITREEQRHIDGHATPEKIASSIASPPSLARTRYRGLERTQLHAHLVAAAYNLLRIARLSPAPA